MLATMAKSKQRLTKLEGRPNLRGWNLDAIDDFSEKAQAGIEKLSRQMSDMAESFSDRLQGLILRAAGEALDIAMKDAQTRVDWEHQWKDDKVHPLTISIKVALGPDEENEPVYAFNLRDTLIESIRSCQGDGTGLSDEYWPRFIGIMRQLRSLADEIESELPK